MILVNYAKMLTILDYLMPCHLSFSLYKIDMIIIFFVGWQSYPGPVPQNYNADISLPSYRFRRVKATDAVLMECDDAVMPWTRFKAMCTWKGQKLRFPACIWGGIEDCITNLVNLEALEDSIIISGIQLKKAGLFLFKKHSKQYF